MTDKLRMPVGGVDIGRVTNVKPGDDAGKVYRPTVPVEEAHHTDAGIEAGDTFNAHEPTKVSLLHTGIIPQLRSEIAAEDLEYITEAYDENAIPDQRLVIKDKHGNEVYASEKDLTKLTSLYTKYLDGVNFHVTALQELTNQKMLSKGDQIVPLAQPFFGGHMQTTSKHALDAGHIYTVATLPDDLRTTAKDNARAFYTSLEIFMAEKYGLKPSSSADRKWFSLRIDPPNQLFFGSMGEIRHAKDLIQAPTVLPLKIPDSMPDAASCPTV